MAEAVSFAGKNVFIRTVTLYYTGKFTGFVRLDSPAELPGASAHFVVLEDAAWIADTGRFSAALATGTFSEVEPYPDGTRVLVAAGSIVDICEWPHALPRVVK